MKFLVDRIALGACGWGSGLTRIGSANMEEPPAQSVCDESVTTQKVVEEDNSLTQPVAAPAVAPPGMYYSLRVGARLACK